LMSDNGQNRAKNMTSIDGSDSSDNFPKAILDNKRNIQDSIEKPTDKIPDSIYRLGHSDRWACKNCNMRDDKWGMIKHPQYCKAGNQSKQNSMGR
jgi:hypothetical protein